MGTLWAKKIAIFNQLGNFVDKVAFNFHSFNKINGFVTSQYATTNIIYFI